jgi:glycosyltransferase involved in cell wall biosynthesis
MLTYQNSALVSIIIPIFNAAPFLAETINCAISQDWSNKEIILIDDGSTDNSLAIAKKYENEWIKVYSQSKKGGSAARNYGLQEAKGEFIQFLDADDLMAKDKISVQMSILLKNPDCIIGCNWVRFKSDLNDIFGIIGPHELLREDLDPVDWLQKRHTMLLHGWLTPKSLITKAGYWNESISINDDGEYFCRVVTAAKKVLFTEKTIVYYRSGIEGSVSSIKNRKRFESEYLAAVTFKNTLNSLNKDKASTIAIANNFKLLVYEMYPNHKDLIQLCKSHEEYKYANIKFRKFGLTGKLVLLIGWRATKILKTVLKKLIN